RCKIIRQRAWCWQDERQATATKDSLRKVGLCDGVSLGGRPAPCRRRDQGGGSNNGRRNRLCARAGFFRLYELCDGVVRAYRPDCPLVSDRLDQPFGAR